MPELFTELLEESLLKLLRGLDADAVAEKVAEELYFLEQEQEQEKLFNTKC